MVQDNLLCCSVVVVCKDNLSEVKKTIISLLKDGEVPACAEVLVIDDSSEDGISRYIGSLELENLRYLRGDGVSLYSAMNVGIENSTGTYLWFLNSGDCKSEEFEITDLHSEMADIVYGDTDYVEHGVIVRKQTRPGFKLLTTQQLNNFLPCHQSIFFRRKLIVDNNLRYNTDLKISADYKFLEAIVEAGATVLYRPTTISEFALGGISNKYNSFSQVILHARELKQTRRLSLPQFLILAMKLCRKLRF